MKRSLKIKDSTEPSARSDSLSVYLFSLLICLNRIPFFLQKCQITHLNKASNSQNNDMWPEMGKHINSVGAIDWDIVGQSYLNDPQLSIHFKPDKNNSLVSLCNPNFTSGFKVFGAVGKISSGKIERKQKHEYTTYFTLKYQKKMC